MDNTQGLGDAMDRSGVKDQIRRLEAELAGMAQTIKDLKALQNQDRMALRALYGAMVRMNSEQ